MTAVLKKFIQNGSNIDLDYKTFIITEDMCDVVVDSTKGVAPYNTSYGMTWITIKDGYGVEWREGWMYRFIIDTKLVVVSATRNVGIRIGTNGTYIPMKNRGNTILAGSSYMTKARTDEYMYKTTYESGGALHLCAGSDTTYSAMSVSEGKTGTATSARTLRSDYLKQIIEYHAGNLDASKADDSAVVKLTGNQTIAGTKTFSTSPVVPSKTSAATNTGTAIATEAQVYLKANNADVVKLTGNQTIAGTKTFSTSPVVPSKTSAATNTGTAIATEAQVYLKANNADVVKLTGNQTVAGTKTFSTSPVVPSKTANVANTGTAIATEAQVYNILPTVMTASEYSQVSNPIAGKIYFIKQS